METTSAKRKRLEEILRRTGPCLVAFSGGGDSTFLLWVARSVLGGELLAVTVDSPLVPRRELRQAEEIAREFGVRHRVESVTLSSTVTANPPDRCYHCKRMIMERLLEIARSEGGLEVVEGSTVDDLSQYRPGRAALAELGIGSPLLEAGLTKDEIRILSREGGLSTWEKPSAPCLATRVPYGAHLTPEILGRIETAEESLRGLGFRILRVRHHGDLARIELDDEGFSRAAGPLRHRVVECLTRAGYRQVTLDLEGYRSGCFDPQPQSGGTE